MGLLFFSLKNRDVARNNLEVVENNSENNQFTVPSDIEDFKRFMESEVLHNPEVEIMELTDYPGKKKEFVAGTDGDLSLGTKEKWIEIDMKENPERDLVIQELLEKESMVICDAVINLMKKCEKIESTASDEELVSNFKRQSPNDSATVYKLRHDSGKELYVWSSVDAVNKIESRRGRSYSNVSHRHKIAILCASDILEILLSSLGESGQRLKKSVLIRIRVLPCSDLSSECSYSIGKFDNDLHIVKFYFRDVKVDTEGLFERAAR